MDKRIMLSIILGLILLTSVVTAHEENDNEFFHHHMMGDFGSHMWFGTGYWMPGVGMFYGTLILAGIILLIIYLVLNSNK